MEEGKVGFPSFWGETPKTNRRRGEIVSPDKAGTERQLERSKTKRCGALLGDWLLAQALGKA